MVRGRSQVVVLFLVLLACSSGFLITMLYWGTQQQTYAILGNFGRPLQSIRRWSIGTGRSGREASGRGKQVEWKLFGEEFMTEKELNEIHRVQSNDGPLLLGGRSLLRSIRQSRGEPTNLTAGGQETARGRLRSVSARFQHQLESSWPLSCHPSAQGLFPLKYERFAKALEEYAKFHRKTSPKVLMDNKEEQARVLVWQCSTLDYCGGLADRMKGITYSLLLAIFSRRRLIINWDDTYLEPNLINWKDDIVYEMLKSVNDWGSNLSQPAANSDKDHDDPDQPGIHDSVNYDDVYVVKAQLYSKLGSLPEYPYEFRMFSILGGTGIDNSEYDIIYTLRTIGGPAKYTFLSTNLEPCTLKDSYKNGNQDWIKDGLKWVGLDHLSLEDIDDIVGMVMRYMFKVKGELVEEVARAGRALGLSGQLYTSVHIRTGFAGSLQQHESIQLPKFVRDKHDWVEMLKCAVQTADSFHGPSSPILLATDSMIIKHMAVSKYGGRFRTLNNRLLHVDKMDKIPHHLQENEVEGVVFTWVDMLLLAESHVQVGGTSGYIWAANLFCYLPDDRRINAETCTVASKS